MLSFQKLPEAVSILTRCILKAFQTWQTLNGSPWGRFLTVQARDVGWKGFQPLRQGWLKPQRGSLGTRAGTSAAEKGWLGLQGLGPCQGRDRPFFLAIGNLGFHRT